MVMNKKLPMAYAREENKMGYYLFFSRRVWVQEPRHSETIHFFRRKLLPPSCVARVFPRREM